MIRAMSSLFLLAGAKTIDIDVIAICDVVLTARQLSSFAVLSPVKQCQPDRNRQLPQTIKHKID